MLATPSGFLAPLGGVRLICCSTEAVVAAVEVWVWRRGVLAGVVVVAAADHPGEHEDAADDHKQDGGDDEDAAEAR